MQRFSVKRTRSAAPTAFEAAVSCFRAGKWKEAEALCRKILERAPAEADAMHLLGLSLVELGGGDEGERWLREAASLRPGNPVFHFSLGNTLQARGQNREAEACFTRVITLNPNHADAYYNLANLHFAEKNFEKAILSFREALRLNPDMAGGWHNLGAALAASGEKAAALDCYKRAAALNPKAALSLNSMGVLLKEAGDPAEARDCFARAAAVAPGYAVALINLGNVCLELSDYDSAARVYEEALRLAPNLAEVHYNLANLHSERGNPAEAVAGYQTALRLKPDYSVAAAHLYHQAVQVCDFSLAGTWGDRVDADTRESLLRGLRPAEMPFIHLIREQDPERNLAVAAAWSKGVAEQLAAAEFTSSGLVQSASDGKITIGYLSGDFRHHPVALLMAGIFGLHDRSRFQVFGYAYGPDDQGEVRQRIAAGCDRFTDLGSLPVAEAARKINEDGVQILVDLTGHTRGNRIGICALRPAPIQAAYMGFIGSSGADFMDYILTDAVVTPPDQQRFYSEKFVYLPDTFMATDDRQPVSDRKYSRSEFGLPEEAFVFCSFNNAYKIDLDVFDCWMRILAQMPGSVLWLYAGHALTAENLKREAAERGISPDRLVFTSKLPMPDHLARLKLADLCLDSWRYNGGATTVNSLWAGVPVLTLLGNRFVSRMTASVLSALGLPELIARKPEAYETLAVRLAQAPLELSAFRARLSENRLTAPLFDTRRFTANLERAYEAMWGKYRRGEKPDRMNLV